MAGSYPDVPGNRMALDRDGSQGFMIANNVPVVQLSQEEMRALGDESTDGFPTGGRGFSVLSQLTFFFPELRHVSGYWGWSDRSDPNNSGYVTIVAVEVSSDSTNGVDGTWSPLGPLDWNRGGYFTPLYRQNIVGLDADNVRSIRFSLNARTTWYGETSLHLYGFPMPGQATNRLGVWHPSLNQQVSASALDWGDTPAGSSATRTFRVKNLSASMTAVAPLLGFDTLTDIIPSLLSRYTLSPDGSHFFPQLTLPDLAPGAISAVVTVRRDTPADAVLSVWALRLVASATRWS